MAKTFVINEGVRRAKAADLAGRKEIWAQIDTSSKEEKIPVADLLSPKKEIVVRTPEALARWLEVRKGMADEPDLFPPIHVSPGSKGTPISKVVVVG